MNKRPVQDKIIKKALMDAYYRQIAPNEYPLALLMIDAKPSFVDVNVHPRKLEVKFADSRKVYDLIYSNVIKSLGEHRISTISQQFSRMEVSASSTPVVEQNSMFGVEDFATVAQPAVTQAVSLATETHEQLRDKEIGDYKVIGQLRNSYILVESADSLFYIDQHALAERILFENIKAGVKDGHQSEILLQPITIEITNLPNIDQKLDEINALGFDVSMIGENKVAIYSVPQIFSVYKIDMESIFNHILYLEKITFDHILDKIFATHACKVSIKAGDRLSLPEMTNLVKEGLSAIS